MKFSLKNKIAFTIFAVMISIAIFAPFLSPYNPWDMDIPFLAPCSSHILGTNDLGQDIFSELIYGFRISMFIGIFSSIIVTFIGSTLGILSAYYGGIIDALISGLINIGMTIPTLPLTIVLVAFLKPGMINIVIAICITGWTSTARIIRSKTLQIKEMSYIKNAKTLSASNSYVMFHHILPNVGNLVFIKGSLSIASAMLTEASLSYLGLGSTLYKSWGIILRDSFNAGGMLNGYWWWYIPPILCICISILTVSSLSKNINYN